MVARVCTCLFGDSAPIGSRYFALLCSQQTIRLRFCLVGGITLHLYFGLTTYAQGSQRWLRGNALCKIPFLNWAHLLWIPRKRSSAPVLCSLILHQLRHIGFGIVWILVTVCDIYTSKGDSHGTDPPFSTVYHRYGIQISHPLFLPSLSEPIPPSNITVLPPL